MHERNITFNSGKKKNQDSDILLFIKMFKVIIWATLWHPSKQGQYSFCIGKLFHFFNSGHLNYFFLQI
jgi:hypothetical protein